MAEPTARRHDVDAVRAVALLLLILVHAQASFSEDARSLMMISPSSWRGDSPFFDAASAIYVMLSIWRIPVLFVVAGMAAWFSLKNRTLGGFALERLRRIGVPLAFGTVAVFPIAIWLARKHYTGYEVYIIAPGHLWFLVNILIYVFVLVAFLILANAARPESRNLPGLMGKPAILFAMFAAALIAVAGLENPRRLGDWYRGEHTALFGLVCFIAGYAFAKAGEPFRQWTDRRFFRFLVSAVLLFALRLIYPRQGLGIEAVELNPRLINALVALEAACWIIAVLGLAGRLIKGPSRLLGYATLAIFPVYILQYPVQNVVAWVIRDAHPSRAVLFVLLIVIEIAVCLALFEAIRRMRWFRALFGMRA